MLEYTTTKTQQDQHQSILPGTNTPLPEKKTKLGPLTHKKIRNVCYIYCAGYLLSALLIYANLSHKSIALALGIMLPGGGLWYADQKTLAAFNLFLIFISLTANKYALPTIWLGGAFLAALITNNTPCQHALYFAPLFGPGCLLWIKIRSDIRFKQAKARAETLNVRLNQHTPITIRSDSAKLGSPLSPHDVAHAKFILDRALQPIDEFHGFEELEPWGTSAIRYQLNYAQYALAFYQYCHTPAFTGYLQEAQKRLIIKMTDLKAWGYWKSENLWGNLDRCPDPIRRDNIMFSGYLSQMVGTYATLNNDPSFNQPNALTFRAKENEQYHYNQHSIAEKIRDNFRKSEFCLYPCEPNWSYTMCNPFGLNSLIMNDRLLGTSYSQEITPPYQKRLLEEFMTADGHYVPIRSMIWGINIPGFYLAVNDGLAAFLHHPSLPDIAETTWEMMRYRYFNPDAELPFYVNKTGRVDIGNYRYSLLGPYSILMLAAKEMGDLEVYDQLVENINQQYNPHTNDHGELIYKGSSNLTSFIVAASRFIRPGAFHDLVVNGMPEAWQQGPVLSDVPYPDIYVLRAVNENNALSIELMVNNNGTHSIAFQKLIPNKKYRITGSTTAEMTADHIGNAWCNICGHGRHQIKIYGV